MVFRSLLITILALGSFAFGVLRAQAVTLNPPIFEFVMSPGEHLEDTIKVFNDRTYSVKLRPEKVNFTAKPNDETSGAPEFYPRDEIRTGRELAPWIDITETATSVEALTRRDIPFTISVPEDAGPGSYFGAIILKNGEMEGRGVGLVTGTAVLVLVRVEGDIVESADLSNFLSDNAIVAHLPVRFEARVINTGTVHLQPSGHIEIRNIFGKIVGRVPINPDLLSVLPDSARRYTGTWGRSLGAEDSEISRQWKGFAIGRYTALLEMNYGQDGETLTASTVFWVIPWMVLTIFIIGIFGIFFFTRIFFRWYARYVIARHHKENSS